MLGSPHSSACSRVDYHAVVEGEVLPEVSFATGASEVSEYQRATGDLSSGLVVPPLALVALALAAMTERMPLPPSTVHAGQSVTFYCAVPIGSEIAVQFRVRSRREQQQKIVTTFDMRLL